jgi:hypothetical protein
MDRATQGKMANTKTVRVRKFGKVQNFFRTGREALFNNMWRNPQFCPPFVICGALIFYSSNNFQIAPLLWGYCFGY